MPTFRKFKGNDRASGGEERSSVAQQVGPDDDARVRSARAAEVAECAAVHAASRRLEGPDQDGAPPRIHAQLGRRAGERDGRPLAVREAVYDPQFANVAREVEDKGIVIIDQKDHGRVQR